MGKFLPERQLAIKTNNKKYHGRPCKNCNSTLKFTSGKSCVHCVSVRMSQRSAKKQRDYSLRKNHGITLKEFNELNKQQKGRCYICNDLPNGHHFTLVVDHDHKTNKLRKLLCDRCNRVLGFVQDNANILQNMVKYLT